MVGQAQLPSLPGVIEGAGDVSASFAEVGPAVVVRRDGHTGTQDRGRGCRPDAVHGHGHTQPGAVRD